MSWVFVLAIVVVVAAAFLAVAGKKAGTGSKVGFPYIPAKALFSPAERSFLGVLDQAVGPEHRVFGKVRVADLASVKPGLGNAARQGALNRVAAKHFDFVVCRASDLSVICAVELNDSSHSSKRAQTRDELLTKVCESIGLPLFQVPAKHAYSVQELQAQFASVIGVAPVVAAVAT
ncbi:MAG: DUF2726 domain-containing protein [Pseudomonadales bacterium]|jgi:hypothetical protein|nr:DUF2726 domain-containing protein [Pseudomonadales bacterium]